ncbi:ParA family protein [Canibacter zhoujuaniae]|uniref:ParA family protein n=1 Tax=Canibacter zhoujuaniae TaxID=2708343 RepID=UPI001420198A|nr:ParA family protein [Canibacter zhoujuaniae]
MKVISISSLKGGVGKTTVTLGLASAAFSRGLRTLVVDADPQSDVSTGLDVEITSENVNIADVLSDPSRVREAIIPSGWGRHHAGTIDLLLGSPSAINFDGPHPSMREVWRLEEALAQLENDYDLVLIDSAPSLNALTRIAWTASDRVLVVTEPGLFSVAAADRALRAIDELRAGVSPRLDPLGVVVNRVRPQSQEHQFRIRELREIFGELVLDPVLPERTTIQQATGAAKPVHMWPGETTQQLAASFDFLLDTAAKSLNMSIPPAGPVGTTELITLDAITTADLSSVDVS